MTRFSVLLFVVVGDTCIVVLIMMVMIVVLIVVVYLEDVLSSVGESGVDASQDVSTSTNHIGSEGELLAVED